MCTAGGIDNVMSSGESDLGVMIGAEVVPVDELCGIGGRERPEKPGDLGGIPLLRVRRDSR